MSQLVRQLLESNTAYAGRSSTLNLAYGGQWGYAPNYSQWLNNQAYVRPNARAVLLSAPKMFTRLPNAREWIRTLKALVEIHPKRITGFDFGLTVNVAKHDIGAGGQQQGEPVKTVRNESTPAMTFQSKVGRPEQRFIEAWIRMILDPDTTYSSSLYLPSSVTANGSTIDTFFADQYAATILVFEPNQSFTRVEKAGIVHNFWPTTTGPIVMESNPVDDMQLEELEIPFEGFVEPCRGAEELAQGILNNINFVNANPCTRKASYPGIDSDVAAQTDIGYAAGVSNTIATQLAR